MATNYSYNSSLYVGDLDPEVTEQILFEVFNKIGPVSSVRVCRDVHFKNSLGYGYVNFHNHNDAERALETLNFTQVLSRPVRIMYSQRDPSLRKSGVGNIFVKNIPPTVDSKALFDTFSKFGQILSLKLPEENGLNKGYAYIHYEKAEDAERAIAEANNMLLGGDADSPLQVEHFRPRQDRTSQQFTNLYVKNLPDSLGQEAALRALFQPFGTVSSIKVDRDTKGRPFGFVNFENPDAAAKAVETLHDKEIDGAQLYVQRAQKKAERAQQLRVQQEQRRTERVRRFQGMNLYVKNLEDSVDDAKLRDAFSKQGTVTSARVMRDDKGRSRGFGFVCFSTADEAQRALTEMQGQLLGTKPVFVAMHQLKEQRRMFLEQVHSARAAMVPGQFPPQGGMYPMPMFYPGGRGMPQAQGQYPYPMMRGAAWARPGAMPRQGGQPMYGMQGMPGAQRPQRRQNRQGQVPMGMPAMMQQMGVPQQGAQGQQRMPQGQQQFQYKQGVRNQPMQQTDVQGGDKAELTAETLAQKSPEEQKRLLGERLYPLVAKNADPSLVAKITGMLLQMDTSDILHLVEDEAALSEGISEAIAVLSESGFSQSQPVATD